jgi:hypothetical protein
MYSRTGHCLHLDVPVAASGDWRIAINGNLAHTSLKSLNLGLNGNLTVDAGGMISAHRRGHLSGGPGGASGNYTAGPSHGGRGGVGYTPFRSTYGSVLGPTNWGSQNNMRGGGAVKLAVSGTLTLNGAVDADGDRTFKNNDFYGSGSGGSVWLKAGAFAGGGTVSASGGDGYVGPGGGGRISLVEVAGAGLDGLSCQASGGYSSKAKFSAPGTFYRQRAGVSDGAGTVTVNAPSTWTPGTDAAGTNTYCELPPSLVAVSDELKRATLRIETRGRVGLSANMTVGDLYLVGGSAAYPQLILNGRTLKVNSYFHKDWGNAAWVVYGGGKIVWKSGMLLMVR